VTNVVFRLRHPYPHVSALRMDLSLTRSMDLWETVRTLQILDLNIYRESNWRTCHSLDGSQEFAELISLGSSEPCEND